MMQYFRIVVVLFLIGAGVLLAGCTGNSGTDTPQYPPQSP